MQELERKYFLAVDRESRYFGPNGAGGSDRYIFLRHVAFDGEEGKLRKTHPSGKPEGYPSAPTKFASDELLVRP